MENRVITIRSLNPADIPSRGMRESDLANTPVWLDGPGWLRSNEGLSGESVSSPSVPEESRCEMRRKDAAHSLITLEDDSTPCLSQHIAE